MLKPLLIEIGVEELPAIPFLKELPNIEKKWLTILEKYSMTCEFEFYYTPRRLVLWHRKFKVKQEDSLEEFFGAPLAIAYKDGKPTGAFNGFVKKTEANPEDIGSVKKGKKEVLYYKKSVRGLDAVEILPALIREFLESLNFGKSMRWGRLTANFIRPIRWINLFLGDEYVEFNLFGVKSGNESYPHRTISYKPFTFSFAGDYFCKLDKAGVILYPNERKKKIVDEFERIEKKFDIKIDRDGELLAEVVAITENPTALIGEFDEEFLTLPPEVVITSMKEHQRYFPVFKDEKLTNRFIVVSNAITEDFTQIIKGNEKVLKARLSDGLFFYKNDLKNGLQTDGLKNILFIKDGGTLKDKVQREEIIALSLFDKYKTQMVAESGKDESELRELLIQAVRVSKADLLSEMVYEFTELQGLMGYYYATILGEDKMVASAIKEQYLPLGSDSELPSNSFNAIVALAIKIDSIKTIFSVGKIPTGTKDPYALRRAVLGIIKISIDRGFKFDFRDILSDFPNEYAQFEFKKLEEFFLERIYKYFEANVSIIKAVVASGERDISEIDKKITALNIITSSTDFPQINSSFKRVSNIIKDVKLDSYLAVDKSLFTHENEKNLFEQFNKIKAKTYNSYEEELDALFGLKPEIDNFFDSVMVNDKDEKIKTNRKNLLATIYKAFKKIGDIKEITI